MVTAERVAMTSALDQREAAIRNAMASPDGPMIREALNKSCEDPESLRDAPASLLELVVGLALAEMSRF